MRLIKLYLDKGADPNIPVGLNRGYNKLWVATALHKAVKIGYWPLSTGYDYSSKLFWIFIPSGKPEDDESISFQSILIGCPGRPRIKKTCLPGVEKMRAFVTNLLPLEPLMEFPFVALNETYLPLKNYY